MIGKLISLFKYYSRLSHHRREWAKANVHNRTIASTFFPRDKVKIGNHTYGDLHIISYGDESEGLEIGHYVSIANDVKFLLGGNHYYKRFSTYPFVAKFQDQGFVETWSKGKIAIGDDVWIGTEVFILPGVTIGRGAILAARAVVTQDIPPYAIAGGNPARVIRYRFNEEGIKQASQIDFSKLSPEFVKNNLDLYRKENDFTDIINKLNEVLIDRTNTGPKEADRLT